MGGCFSKKTKKGDPSSSPRGGRKGEKAAAAAGSRDPPPTESPQEEKVKEVLSEITRQNSSKKKTTKESNGGFRDATVDRSQLSDEFSAASTTLTETTTAATVTRGAAEDDEEVEGEIEMMKKMRPAVTRSRFPAKLQKKTNRSDFSVRQSHHRQGDAGKREIRGVDVGCRSARSSPLPARVRAREKGNAATRNRISSSAAAAAAGGGGHNNYNNYKRETGERSGRRSSSSAAMKRSAAAAAAAPAPAMDQGQCRSSINLSASTASTATRRANGRFSPQRAPPARVLHLEEGRRGQDGNNAVAVGGGEDGNVLEAKESLENPLVSMECFIFL